MPSIICPKCVMRLKLAFEFVQLAHTSEKNLKAFLTRISTDFEEVSKISNSVNSTSQLSVEDHDEIIALLEDTADDNSNKIPNNWQPGIAPQPESSKHASHPFAETAKQNVPKEERHTQYKQESLEFSAEEEEIVYYDDANFVDESENEESEHKAIISKSTTNEDCLNDNNPKLIAEQNQANGYLEEFAMTTETDANSYNENLATHYIYDNSTEDDTEQCNNDHDMHLEIEMQEKSALTSSVIESESLQLYDDTDEEISNEVNDNLVSTQAVEHGKQYLNLELSDVDQPSALLMSKNDDLRPIELVSISTNQSNPVALTKPAATLISPLKHITSMTDVADEEVGEEGNRPTTARAGWSPSRTQQKIKRSDKLGSSGRASINARFFCVKCNRDFSTKTNLTRHMATHEGVKPYQCLECSKSFSQRGSLKQHMYTHTGEKPFICEVCDRGFTQCKSLVFHMRRHTGEKPFPCEHCGMFFRQKDGLKTHILKHHMIRQTDGDTETLICAICKKMLATKFALQVHMKKHINYHRLVPQNTTQRTVATTSKSLLDIFSEDDLISEKTFMSEELALSIEDVTSSTQILDTMTANTAKASRVKKFQCRKCYKCFAIKKNLLRHLTTHDVNGSELFQCPSCQIAFDTNYALRVHRVREHRETGINLNECELCNIVFANSTELGDHNSAVHDATDQSCPVCPELQFNSKKQLLDHLMEHENLTMEEDD